MEISVSDRYLNIELGYLTGLDTYYSGLTMLNRMVIVGFTTGWPWSGVQI